MKIEIVEVSIDDVKDVSDLVRASTTKLFVEEVRAFKILRQGYSYAHLVSFQIIS